VTLYISNGQNFSAALAELRQCIVICVMHCRYVVIIVAAAACAVWSLCLPVTYRYMCGMLYA